MRIPKLCDKKDQVLKSLLSFYDQKISASNVLQTVCLLQSEPTHDLQTPQLPQACRGPAMQGKTAGQTPNFPSSGANACVLEPSVREGPGPLEAGSPCDAQGLKLPEGAGSSRPGQAELSQYLMQASGQWGCEEPAGAPGSGLQRASLGRRRQERKA